MIIFKDNQLYYFWLVGKFTFEKQSSCENIISKSSKYLSYYFGNSKSFSLENIMFMKKLYLYFPMFNENMNKLDWNSYLELMKINNKDICYFYYRVALFCKFEFVDIKRIIDNDIYNRI